MQFTALTWLGIASCFQQVSPRSTEHCDLSAVLGEMEELRYLDVSAWYEDAAATVSICGLSAQLSKLEHLQQLYLYGNGLDNVRAAWLGPAVEKLGKLTKLSVFSR